MRRIGCGQRRVQRDERTIVKGGLSRQERLERFTSRRDRTREALHHDTRFERLALERRQVGSISTVDEDERNRVESGDWMMPL